jgi:hypothetical protein
MNWKEVNSGLEDRDIYSIGSLDDYLFVGNRSGTLWRRSIAELTEAALPVEGERHDRQTNDHFRFIRNVTDNTLSVSIELEKSGPVTISLFSLNGRRISLIPGVIMKTGNYYFTWNVSFLSPGCYQIHASAGTYYHSERLLVIK